MLKLSLDDPRGIRKPFGEPCDIRQLRLEQVLEGVHFLMESSLPDVPALALGRL